MDSKRKETIKACVAMAIIILIIAISIILTIKYNVEGEKKMPFKLAKITMVSTAEGVENVGATEKWNFKIYQNNDVYFSFEKTENCEEDDKIKTINIENIQITQNPAKGKIVAFMPNSGEGRAFSYEEQYQLTENKLTYKGAAKSDTRTLELGNQGGTAVIRFSNIDLGDYVSEEEEEIKHDGTLLQKTQVVEEELKFKVSFDLVITTRNQEYKTNINLDLPSGAIMENGNAVAEKEGTEFIFKRI